MRSATSITAAVNITGFLPASSAQVYRYSDASLNAIVPLPDQALAGGGFTASFPTNSITLVCIAPATPTANTHSHTESNCDAYGNSNAHANSDTISTSTAIGRIWTVIQSGGGV